MERNSNTPAGFDINVEAHGTPAVGTRVGAVDNSVRTAVEDSAGRMEAVGRTSHGTTTSKGIMGGGCFTNKSPNISSGLSPNTVHGSVWGAMEHHMALLVESGGETAMGTKSYDTNVVGNPMGYNYSLNLGGGKLGQSSANADVSSGNTGNYYPANDVCNKSEQGYPTSRVGHAMEAHDQLAGVNSGMVQSYPTTKVVGGIGQNYPVAGAGSIMRPSYPNPEVCGEIRYVDPANELLTQFKQSDPTFDRSKVTTDSAVVVRNTGESNVATMERNRTGQYGLAPAERILGNVIEAAESTNNLMETSHIAQRRNVGIEAPNYNTGGRGDVPVLAISNGSSIAPLGRNQGLHNRSSSMSPFSLLEPPACRGFLRIVQPCCYVFPAGRGDSALLAVPGFTLLADGGADVRPAFWNLARHLDRLDALLVTQPGPDSLPGVNSFLRRKMAEREVAATLVEDEQSGNSKKGQIPTNLLVSPELGVVFFDARFGEKTVSGCGACSDAAETLALLACLGTKPLPFTSRPPQSPLVFYHKLGVGRLEMYVLCSAADNCTSVQSSESVAVLLAWHPSEPGGRIVRILFPGAASQECIIDALDNLRHLEWLRQPLAKVSQFSEPEPKTTSAAKKNVSVAKAGVARNKGSSQDRGDKAGEHKNVLAKAGREIRRNDGPKAGKAGSKVTSEEKPSIGPRGGKVKPAKAESSVDSRKVSGRPKGQPTPKKETADLCTPRNPAKNTTNRGRGATGGTKVPPRGSSRGPGPLSPPVDLSEDFEALRHRELQTSFGRGPNDILISEERFVPKVLPSPDDASGTPASSEDDAVGAGGGSLLSPDEGITSTDAEGDLESSLFDHEPAILSYSNEMVGSPGMMGKQSGMHASSINAQRLLDHSRLQHIPRSTKAGHHATGEIPGQSEISNESLPSHDSSIMKNLMGGHAEVKQISSITPSFSGFVKNAMPGGSGVEARIVEGGITSQPTHLEQWDVEESLLSGARLSSAELRPEIRAWGLPTAISPPLDLRAAPDGRSPSHIEFSHPRTVCVGQEDSCMTGSLLRPNVPQAPLEQQLTGYYNSTAEKDKVEISTGDAQFSFSKVQQSNPPPTNARIMAPNVPAVGEGASTKDRGFSTCTTSGGAQRVRAPSTDLSVTFDLKPIEICQSMATPWSGYGAGIADGVTELDPFVGTPPSSAGHTPYNLSPTEGKAFSYGTTDTSALSLPTSPPPSTSPQSPQGCPSSNHLTSQWARVPTKVPPFNGNSSRSTPSGIGVLDIPSDDTGAASASTGSLATSSVLNEPTAGTMDDVLPSLPRDTSSPHSTEVDESLSVSMEQASGSKDDSSRPLSASPDQLTSPRLDEQSSGSLDCKGHLFPTGPMNSVAVTTVCGTDGHSICTNPNSESPANYSPFRAVIGQNKMESDTCFSQLRDRPAEMMQPEDRQPGTPFAGHLFDRPPAPPDPKVGMAEPGRAGMAASGRDMYKKSKVEGPGRANKNQAAAAHPSGKATPKITSGKKDNSGRKSSGQARTPTPSKKGLKSPGGNCTARGSPAPVSYLDLAYVPGHGGPGRVDTRFFHRVRSAHYVLSANDDSRSEPSRVTLDALLAAIASWETPMQVTLIPTYDTPELRSWYQETSREQQRLGLTLLASSSTVVTQGGSFPACKIEF
uniref:mucin-19-like n=1 Tax=Myxine glutinosa TaxID=7769 RepID=UPI00358F7B24